VGCFRVAVQALVVIAHAENACPSSVIAHDIEIHAVLLRRVLAQLARARIVEAREGRDGGYRLARPATQITLYDIYEVFQAPAAPNPDLPGLSGRVNTVLDCIGHEIDTQASLVLRQHTLATLMEMSEAHAPVL
jgi:Rrf2 family protein